MKRIAKLAAIALLVEGIGGCGVNRQHLEPEIKIVETKVPISVPCKANAEVHKTYTDLGAEFVADIYEQARLLLQGRKERMADATRLTGAIVGCGGTVTAK